MALNSTPCRTETGCDQCWSDDQNTAWARADSREFDCALVGESHFWVNTARCADCGQYYMTIFTETIDWEGGEDPQHWAIVPITLAERNNLVSQVDGLTESRLESIAVGRRCLQRDFPKGGEPRIYWSHGLLIDQHD